MVERYCSIGSKSKEQSRKHDFVFAEIGKEIAQKDERTRSEHSEILIAKNEKEERERM